MPLGRIHLYWLLIAIPTLLLGMASVRLLLGEEARLRALARRADLERAERLAETVRGLVATVKQDVLEQLAALPATGYPAALGDWMRRDPRIRNVFVWTPREGVVYPPARGGTVDERRFLQRYAPLFQGEVPWAQHPVAGDGGLARDTPATPERQARAALDQLRAKARPALAAAPRPSLPGAAASVPAADGRAINGAILARTGAARGEAPAAEVTEGRSLPSDAEALPGAVVAEPALAPAPVAESAAPEPGHWRTWFEGNQLYLLGWQRMADGAIRGVELETATLLSRLPEIFASLRDPAMWLALRNGEGGLLAQSGGSAEAPGPIGIVLPLAPELPHWEIVGARLNTHAARRPMLFAAWLLLSLVLAALVSGGLLLARDAAAQRRDALQKTGFVSSVSHELKTPLTSIRLYAELLRDGRVADAPKQSKYLNVIVTESERLTRLVNNVLDFSRMEQGRRRYAIESADLARIVREVAEAQRDRLGEAGLTLVMTGCDAPVSLPVDRDAVEQVLVNLLDNAAKYAAGGGEVAVALRAAPDGAEITVEDRGPGIAPPHRKRLFEAFYRADCELTSRRTGCGLGLSIARRLMRGMGGDLLFAPREGGGCRFTLRVAGNTNREPPT